MKKRTLISIIILFLLTDTIIADKKNITIEKEEMIAFGNSLSSTPYASSVSVAFEKAVEFIRNSTKDVLEDKNLVNMYKELTRCMLVSLIRDRVGHKDISALFTL